MVYFPLSIVDKKNALPMSTKLFHLLAIVTVAIWGTAFVWTKLLLQSGLSPAQIFLTRFTIAYLLLAAFMLVRQGRGIFSCRTCKVAAAPRIFRSQSWREELKMLGLGVLGGSLYFMTENVALLHTTATNTSLIVCSYPLFTSLVLGWFYPAERLTHRGRWGTLLAFVGMVLVVLNGRFVLQMSPLGDTLALASCFSWVGYSLLIKTVSARYSALFLTRKVFFYGVLTILPWFLFGFEPFPPPSLLLRPAILGNLLFLGCVASMLCYLAWNQCMARLGAVACTNWVYINPLTTILFAWIILDEPLTLCFLAGASLILLGLWTAMQKK